MKDHQNLWMSVLIWMNHLSDLTKNPGRNELQNSRFQETPCYMQ